MVKVEQNSNSFFIDDLKYGDKIAIGVNGVIVHNVDIGVDKAKMGVYINKKKSDWKDN